MKGFRHASLVHLRLMTAAMAAYVRGVAGAIRMEAEVMQGNAVPLFIGAWLAFMAVYFIIRGRIRTHSFFGKSEFSRIENPLGFWLAIGFVLGLAFTSITIGLLRHH